MIVGSVSVVIVKIHVTSVDARWRRGLSIRRCVTPAAEWIFLEDEQHSRRARPSGVHPLLRNPGNGPQSLRQTRLQLLSDGFEVAEKTNEADVESGAGIVDENEMRDGEDEEQGPSRLEFRLGHEGMERIAIGVVIVVSVVVRSIS